MNLTVPARTGHVHVSLDDSDKLHVLHPKPIVAYQGAPQSREDRFMDLAGILQQELLRTPNKGGSHANRPCLIFYSSSLPIRPAA